jgi:hypothetical protein
MTNLSDNAERKRTYKRKQFHHNLWGKIFDLCFGIIVAAAFIAAVALFLPGCNKSYLPWNSNPWPADDHDQVSARQWDELPDDVRFPGEDEVQCSDCSSPSENSPGVSPSEDQCSDCSSPEHRQEPRETEDLDQQRQPPSSAGVDASERGETPEEEDENKGAVAQGNSENWCEDNRDDIERWRPLLDPSHPGWRSVPLSHRERRMRNMRNLIEHYDRVCER